ncbi:HD-GYP domain-containing protein [Derxia lacustris]|uniref:HD-GYP domain-containing protein n=1 Tax=Derxia lacustris TaxID=764842 RepID=UPI000A175953|nr:HD domain-containing phosphohydrolase [Derxia lacustris]
MDLRLSDGDADTQSHVGATLLVVDDNPDNIAVLGAMLQPLYRVRVATSGARALEVALTPPEPELILLDRMMPGMDGDEVLARLRLDPRTASIPVMFVTAMSSVDDECAGLMLGAVDYLTKPLVPALVLARVRNQLELKRAHDRLRDINAALEDEVARRMAENQIIQDVTIHALARLAETRDVGTGNHLRRTRAYMRLLASRLREHPRFRAELTGDNIELLAKSALLHDIGKVGIPDSVLLKPGRLDPDERALMETHARLGADAIANAERDAERPVAFLTRAKEIARHHHERWDGRGYPDRLAGDAIPAGARLMALVDAFDTMACRRPYKAPIPLDLVRAALMAERGGQFDPDVVDAFDRAFDDFARIAASYRDDEARP